MGFPEALPEAPEPNTKHMSNAALHQLPEGHSQWPRITVVTPSYNQGRFIEETILSIIGQQYPNLEYFIVDGGSTDETVSVIRKYEDQIDWWVSERDKGQTDAINKGFKKATGDIVNWINSDDILYPDALFHIAQTYMAHPDAGFVYGKTQRFNAEGPMEMMQHDVPDLPLMYYYHFPYGQQGCFYKKSILERVGFLNETLHFSMDFDLFVRLHLHAKTVKTDFLVGGFRDHEASKTNNLESTMIRENMGVFRKFLEAYQYEKGVELLSACGAPTLNLHGYEQPQVQFSEAQLIHMTCRFLVRYIYFSDTHQHYRYLHHALKFIEANDPAEYQKKRKYFDRLRRKAAFFRFFKS
jgi:glycosyltransferase involved in cell wall biosynthesis